MKYMVFFLNGVAVPIGPLPAAAIKKLEEDTIANWGDPAAVQTITGAEGTMLRFRFNQLDGYTVQNEPPQSVPKLPGDEWKHQS